MERVLGGDGLGEEAVAVLLLKAFEDLGEEEGGALAAAVGARVLLVAALQLVELLLAEAVAPRVHPELARVALNHLVLALAVHHVADGAVLLRLEEDVAALAHAVAGRPRVVLGLRVVRPTGRALDALRAAEPLAWPRLERRVEAADVPALVADIADGEADLRAVVLAFGTRLAREALPRRPQVLPRLERRVGEAREVEAVKALAALQHVARRVESVRVDLVAALDARLAEPRVFWDRLERGREALLVVLLRAPEAIAQHDLVARRRVSAGTHRAVLTRPGRRGGGGGGGRRGGGRRGRASAILR